MVSYARQEYIHTDCIRYLERNELQRQSVSQLSFLIQLILTNPRHTVVVMSSIVIV